MLSELRQFSNSESREDVFFFRYSVVVLLESLESFTLIERNTRVEEGLEFSFWAFLISEMFRRNLWRFPTEIRGEMSLFQREDRLCLDKLRFLVDILPE